MFDVGAPEFLLLLVIAIILFGPEKLPELARKTARLVRYLRTMAGTAQDQLSKELGPGFENLDVRDLNPRAFVKKHLLEDVDPIVADVKSDLADAKTEFAGATALAGGNGAKSKAVSAGGPSDVMAAATPVRVPTPFDPDAT
jgi:sec-independent protein translocase protein TatB